MQFHLRCQIQVQIRNQVVHANYVINLKYGPTNREINPLDSSNSSTSASSTCSRRNLANNLINEIKMIRFNTPISTKKNPDTSVPIVPPISWKCGNSSLAHFTDTPKNSH